MLATSVDWKSKREELKAKRKPLFTRYVKNPNDIRMALELKHIDDQIAECPERMELKKSTDEAMKLVATWEFTPLMCNDKPAATVADFVVHFQGR